MPSTVHQTEPASSWKPAWLASEEGMGASVLPGVGVQGDGRVAEILAAVGRIVEQRQAEANARILEDVTRLVSAALRDGVPMASADTSRGAPFLFRKAGSHWDVVFDGGSLLHLEDGLGARYLDYLLHHPNVPISAYDLETTIMPEKAQARPRNSIQEELDPSAVRSCLRQLDQLRDEREQAVEDG